MKLGQALRRTALMALCFLPQCGGEESATPPHPIFAHWHEVLMGQSAPEALYPESLKNGGSLSEEEQRVIDEIRGHVKDAQDAAEALYQARLGIIRGMLEDPGFFMDGDELDELFTTCGNYLAEGFRRDLEALSFGLSWLDAGCVEPPTRPGRQELLFRPELESILALNVDGCTSEICAGYGYVNGLWMKRQDAFMERLHSLYGDGELAPDDSGRIAPFTQLCWLRDNNGELTPATQAFRSDMQARIRHEQEAWKRYLDVMQELMCPSSGYRGSGTGIFMSTYESHLLDSRERFLCLLAGGVKGLPQLNNLNVERRAELQELHVEHAFGEIFSEHATLFRHPRLEGNPWCIRFEGCGAGFIFVHEGNALQRYAAEYPKGGEIEVIGYQSIEQTTTPHIPEEGEEATARPSALRQVFHLITYKTPEGETPEANEE